MRFFFALQRRGTYLTCPIFYAKPEPLGAEFKNFSCSVTGDLLFVETQIGKDFIKKSKDLLHIGEMAACAKRILEEKKGIGQRDVKGVTTYFSCQQLVILK